MKQKTIFIFLVILTSCSVPVMDRKESSGNSTEDTIVQYDSLITGYGGHIIFEYKKNLTELLSTESKKETPLDHTSSLELLGDLNRDDTLKIFAEFAQCGEFGGNREYIYVYRADSTFESRIMKDSVVCHSNQNEKKIIRIENETYSLSKTASKAITDYLELLLRYSLKEKEWHTNVAGYFSASITRGVNYRRDFSIDVFDSEGLWIYFDILKNEIKVSGNTAISSDRN